VSDTISVSIFGSTYTLQVNKNEDEVREIAAMVNQKMMALSSELSLASPLKLAILTALNFAYETKRNKEKETLSDEQPTELIALSRKLESVLNASGAN
jgi:cell division protein ZapA (FtsZ GTPase activity inhibitor)